MKRLIFITLVCLFVNGDFVYGSKVEFKKNSLQLIAKAVEDGKITHEQAIIYGFFVLKDQDSLPDEFHSDKPIKCGTPVFKI